MNKHERWLFVLHDQIQYYNGKRAKSTEQNDKNGGHHSINKLSKLSSSYENVETGEFLKQQSSAYRKLLDGSVSRELMSRGSSPDSGNERVCFRQ